MVRCPKRGELSGGDNFCTKCTTQLWAKCRSCGHPMTVENAYCGNCGAKNPIYTP